MKINVLKPIGWCTGVGDAIKSLQKIIAKHKEQKIYLVGWLTHNKLLMQIIKDRNVIILDDSHKSRLELLTRIKDPQAIIVLSAHGTPQEATEYANTHFKQYYDLTCSHLQDNFLLIKRLIKQGYRIIYYGKQHHPETKTILSFNPHIQLIETISDAQKIKWEHNKKYALVNQSTFPKTLVEQIKNILLATNGALHYINTTCKAMHIRYDNIRELQHTDLLIVVGDPRSNNVNQLLNLAKYYKIKAHLITNLEEIKASIFKDVKNLSVVSGTSVDQKHVEAVVDKIKAIVK